ncbi:MAG: polyprenyl synthetase family protein [Myxococcota bacterium]|nr:polyprenyl synthetase family protein [Myxococcota bacterium]
MIEDILNRVAQMIANRLGTFFDDVGKRGVPGIFQSRADSLLLDQVRDLTLRSGKRLRPALLIHSAALFDATATTQSGVNDAAAAIELLHTYFLIHDDIMDDDDYRRGGPAVHAALAKETGDPHLGQGLGILAGDLAAALSSLLILGIDVEPTRREQALAIFSAMHLDVVVGQSMDMLGNASAAEVAAHKTASYTTVGPLAVGAALGGASPGQIDALAELALPLGIAFQFRDDLLGTFGDPAKTGKPVGTDLIAGKRTHLLEEGLKRATPEQRAALDAVVGNPEAGTAAIEVARDALETCGAVNACTSRIRDAADTFTSGLKKMAPASESRQFLLDVAHFIGMRNE